MQKIMEMVLRKRDTKRYLQSSFGINSESKATAYLKTLSSCICNLRYEGAILGILMCVSGFLEGNIRERLLRDIWEDDNSFAWRCMRRNGAKQYV